MHLETCDLEDAAGAVELDGTDDGRVDLSEQQSEQDKRNQCPPLGKPAEYLDVLYVVADNYERKSGGHHKELALYDVQTGLAPLQKA